MGTSMAVIIEKVENLGWRYIYHYINEKNYSLFALLADVENNYNIKPITELKGIPDDASNKSSMIIEYDYGITYYTLKELKDYVSVFKVITEYHSYAFNGLNSIINILNSFCIMEKIKHDTDIRIIVSFN